MKKSKWTYGSGSLDEVPEGAYGFVYKVSWSGGYYIGQKSFYSTQNKRISKKRAEELYSGKGARKKKERIVSESNWRTYNTSSEHVKKLLREKDANCFV